MITKRDQPPVVEFLHLGKSKMPSRQDAISTVLKNQNDFLAGNSDFIFHLQSSFYSLFFFTSIYFGQEIVLKSRLNDNIKDSK